MGVAGTDLIVVLGLARDVSKPSIGVHAHKQRVRPVPVVRHGSRIPRSHRDLLIQHRNDVGNVRLVSIQPVEFNVACSADLVVSIVLRRPTAKPVVMPSDGSRW